MVVALLGTSHDPVTALHADARLPGGAAIPAAFGGAGGTTSVAAQTISIVALFSAFGLRIATGLAKRSDLRTHSARFELTRIAAAIASYRVAIVTLLRGFFETIATALATRARSNTEEPDVHRIAGGAAAVGSARRTNGIAVIAGLIGLKLAIATECARAARDWASPTRFEYPAIIATAIAADGIPIVAEFVWRLHHAVTATHTAAARLRALIVQFDASAGSVAAVADGGIAVVADLVWFDDAVSAFAAELTGNWARVAGLDALAVACAAVIALLVSVVTQFGTLADAVATTVATCARRWAGVSSFHGLAICRAAITCLMVSVVADLPGL
jgi:hypothetical protein